jgi:CBS domain-containing protein
MCSKLALFVSRSEEIGMRIADVMTRDLPAADPQETIRDAAQEMRRSGIRALPVCEDERLVGIVTDWDLVEALASEGDPGTRPVADVMSTELVAAPPDCTLTDAAELMAEHEVHHLLVRDGDRLAGMLHLDVEWSQLSSAGGPPVASFTAAI